MKTTLMICSGICFVLGSLLHFAWGWLGKPRWLAPLLAVNESVWEHTKLLILPAIGLAPLEARLLGLPTEQVLGAVLPAVGAGAGAMVLFYYFWVGAIGPHGLLVGIGDFALSVAVCFRVTGLLLERGVGLPCPGPALGILMAGLILLTYYPPRLPIFQCGVTGRYGAE